MEIERLAVQEVNKIANKEVIDMADKEEWTPEKVIKIQQLMQDVVSLNAVVDSKDGGGDTEIGDLIEDTESPSAEELMIRDDRHRFLLEIMHKCLSPREIKIMCMRYGFYDGEPKTLEEIGISFNVTRERIRQIESHALRRLKGYMARNKIRSTDI